MKGKIEIPLEARVELHTREYNDVTVRNISNKMVTAMSSLIGLKGRIAVRRCIYQALVWPESGRDSAGIISRSC